MLTLDDEERAFSDSVERYLDQRYDLRAREAIIAAGPYSPEHWRRFAELGWVAAVFDEDRGGFGNAAHHVGVLMERFGQRLVIEPLLTSAIVCGRILSMIDGRADLIDQLIGGTLHLALVESGDWPDRGAAVAQGRWTGEHLTVSGRSEVVLNGAAAEQLIVAATVDDDFALLLIPATRAGVTVAPMRGHDGHNLADISFDDVAVSQADVLASGKKAADAFDLALDWGTAALCAEAIGSMDTLLERTRAYLKTRVQYGHALADFQALQHRLADMFIQLETARSIAGGALDVLDGPAPRRRRLVSAAKISVFRAANFVGKQAVQLHGGMGVSEELDVAHHFKRLTMGGLQFGHERQHLSRFIDSCAAD
jgi:alkylation response protein AidB-like acyl-CoA dehydrogenase